MKILDIRIEMPDDLFEEAYNVALRAAHGIREDLWEHENDIAVAVFDASEEAIP